MGALEVVAEGIARAGIAGLFFAALSLIGFALVPLALQPRSRRLRLAFSLSAGAIITGWAAWVVGSIFGTMASFIVAAMLALASLRRVPEWRREVGAALRLAWKLAARQAIPALILVAICALTIPQLLIPVVDSDGLRYHLAFPRLYLITGSIDFYPWDVTGGFPHTAEMLYLLLLPAGGETAKFLHTLFFLSNTGVVMLLVHRGRRSRTGAFLGGILFAASPLVMAPASAAFIDHIALFHVGAALLILTRGGPARSAAICSGAAFATKITTAPALAALGIVALSRGRPFRTFGWFAGAAALLFLPFAVRNVVHTGDPFYPIGRGLLRIPIEGVSESALQYATRYHERVKGIVGIPWTLQEGIVADEVVGLHHLAGLFLIALAIRFRQTRGAMAVVLAYLAIAMFFRPPIRYLLPMVLCVAAFEGWALARLRPVVAMLIALPLAVPALLLLANTQLRRFAPFDYISARTTKAAYLRAIVPGYEAAMVTNALPRRGRVMAIDFPAPYYFEHPWIVEGILHQPPLQLWLDRGDGAEEVLGRLQQLGVSWLLVTPGYGGGKPWSMIPLGSTAASRIEAARLRQRLRMIRTVGGVDIYEVPGE